MISCQTNSLCGTGLIYNNHLAIIIIMQIHLYLLIELYYYHATTIIIIGYNYNYLDIIIFTNQFILLSSCNYYQHQLAIIIIIYIYQYSLIDLNYYQLIIIIIIGYNYQHLDIIIFTNQFILVSQQIIEQISHSGNILHHKLKYPSFISRLGVIMYNRIIEQLIYINTKFEDFIMKYNEGLALFIITEYFQIFFIIFISPTFKRCNIYDSFQYFLEKELNY